MSPLRTFSPPEKIEVDHRHVIVQDGQDRRVARTTNYLLGAVILLLLLVFLAMHGWAQSSGLNAQGLGGTSSFPMYVDCVSGCSSSSNPSFGATFPSTGLPIGVEYSGNMVNLNADSSGYLYVDCPGCSGVSPFADNASFTAGTTGINLTGGWYSSSPTNCTDGHACAPSLTLDRKLFVQSVSRDKSVGGFKRGNLRRAGLADGASVTLGAKADAKSTATDTTAITVQQVLKEISYMEQNPASRAVTNGGTFAVQATESGTWNVTVNTALPAGTNVIGHVIADSGSTTAVTGNVTAVQATGTNLHAVLDTTSTTAVTQATGTNLHAVLDTTSTTAVTGGAADGSTSSGNPVQIAGKGSGDARVPVVCDNWAPFSLASTTALKVIANTSGKKTYICSLNIVSAAANNVALIAGTKTTNDCDTSTAGLAGGTTAATGWNFAANGGLTQGTGIGVVTATASNSLDVCLLASGSGQLSGVMSYTQF